ncbi:MAG TPA: hypothetical protein VM934_08020 [Pyrinomonadaceae bacterium]|nr:hypothetical protein [Pyrinomonadaceae bacterium]
MSTETKKTEAANEGVARSAPTEQQASQPGVPRRFATGQTVCNVKNEKGKLCNGHLKQLQTAHAASAYLRGDDVLHQCQTCGALYMGPPMGHVRDPRKQQRYVEKDLAAILQAAGGTLPAYDYPVPGWRGAPSKPAAATPKAATPRPAPAASLPAPAGETPEQKKARLVAEHNARLSAADATKTATPAPASEAAPEAPTVDAAGATASVADSSAQADSHRPAAEAQAATGQASAAPMSPAASTASPAAGAETTADLAPEASTELTPGAPKDERTASEASAPSPTTESAAEPTPAPVRKKAAGSGKLLAIAPHLAPPPGETHEEKIARLKSVVDEAKRRAGKLD